MNREKELNLIKELITGLYPSADCGLFNTRNTVGDDMETIYKTELFTLDICYNWSYFEIFGTTDEEFKMLEQFYDSLENK